jgi:hypothetical protein
MVGHFQQSPYSNVFYSYKAPHRQKDWQESRVEGQIENNVTRALLNVLWHCSNQGDTGLVRAFIKQMVNLKSMAPYDFELLKSRKGIHDDYQQGLKRRTNGKSLLVIYPIGDPELEESAFRNAKVEKRYSIPDGWMFGSKLAIAIESKTNEHVRAGQLKRHIKHQLEEDHSNFGLVKQNTWIDVYRFFKDPRNSPDNENSKFLVEQFCQYLELCGLGGFAGFTSIDFDFFTMNKQKQGECKDLRFALIGKMWNLAGTVYDEVKEKYKEYRDPGKDLKSSRNKYEYAQAYFICEPLPSDIEGIEDDKERSRKETEFIEEKMREKAHICVQLKKDSLAVFACATGEKGIERLRNKITSDGGRNLACALAKVQHKVAPVYFNLYLDDKARGYRSLLKHGESQISAGTTIENLQKLAGELLQRLAGNKGKKQLTFTFTRYLSKDDVIKEGSGVVTTVADIIRAIHPVVKFVNS